MAVGDPRLELIKKINELFGPSQIADTAKKARRLGARADVFEILHALGVFPWVKGKSVARYRRSLPIPPVNQRILTAAFRAALFGDNKPTPLRFDIFSSRTESVEVNMSAKRIDVVLLRVDPPGARRPRPRS